MGKGSLKYFLTLIWYLIFFDAFAQPLNANDTSDKSVRRYQNIIENNRQLVSFIEYTFSSRGVPKHLRNLAIIESGLDQNIVSHAGAKGLWQFMVEHANHYGLSESERADMYKSTKTAVNSLINLYNRYGNWVTVVAAYNCGEGNIQKAMNKAESKKYIDFAAYLPAETRNHVQKYLNASYATGELQQVLNDYYGKTSVQTPMAVTKNISSATPEKIKATAPKLKKIPAGLSEITLNAAYNIDAIAKYLNIDKQEILKWNPNIEKNLAKKGESSFLLPDDLMMRFKLNKSHILTSSLKNTKKWTN